jgi:hypothetical protein
MLKESMEHLRLQLQRFEGAQCAVIAQGGYRRLCFGPEHEASTATTAEFSKKLKAGAEQVNAPEVFVVGTGH